MPEWLIGFLIGGTGGGVGIGLLSHWLHAKVDADLAAKAEGRQFRREDLTEQRDALLVFLGELRAHFSWLVNTDDPRNAGGEPTAHEKAKLIGEWVNKNAPRFPKDRRGHLGIISHIAYQLERGDRHFLDANPQGHQILEWTWEALEEYADELTEELSGHNPAR